MVSTSNVLRCTAQSGLRVQTASFDPTSFGEGGFTFWLGPKNGDGLEGPEEDRDERSDSLVTIDFSKVEFLNCYKNGENSFKGEEKLNRLKQSRRIRYGPSVAQGLLWNSWLWEEDSVLEHIYKDTGITCIDFPGRILRDSEGCRCILFLCRDEDGQWDLHHYRLYDVFGTQDFSATSEEIAA